MVLCTSTDKGPYMSGVWWLNVVRFRRFARAIVRPEKKKNNKDSTEIRKTIKDSNVLESFNNNNNKFILSPNFPSSSVDCRPNIYPIWGRKNLETFSSF